MDWNFEQYNGSEYKFYELFDLNTDPWQLSNLYYHSTNTSLKQQLHDIAAREFKCRGETCA
jgi:hypothetical protein